MPEVKNDLFAFQSNEQVAHTFFSAVYISHPTVFKVKGRSEQHT